MNLSSLTGSPLLGEHQQQGNSPLELLSGSIHTDIVSTRVATTMEQFATYQQHEGIFTKPYVIQGAKSMAPAKWWATYGKHLPLLAGVARRVLAQPCCASAAERNWSVYGKIKTAERSRLKHDTGDKLVYCHEALHLKLKLQDAGYKQKVEKWDTVTLTPTPTTRKTRTTSRCENFDR